MLLLRGRPKGDLECGLVTIAALCGEPLSKVRGYAERKLGRKWPYNLQEASYIGYNTCALNIKAALEASCKHFLGVNSVLSSEWGVVPVLLWPDATMRGMLLLKSLTEAVTHLLAMEYGQVIDSSSTQTNYTLSLEAATVEYKEWLPIRFIPVPAYVRRIVRRGNGSKSHGRC